ncbi:hypothetical protein IQ238_25075 [Pleurocapsales cyanobacterium LEGE 06147]|nr:hypothetical protein [Pleurocapsales cyanobacterium LEGE 06147]
MRERTAEMPESHSGIASSPASRTLDPRADAGESLPAHSPLRSGAGRAKPSA